MSLADIVDHNWEMPPVDHPDFWDVDADTYINGVPVIIDLDLSYGYLLEIVERDTLTLSYVVVVSHPHGHESDWYQPDAGTYRHPNVDYHTVSKWAVDTIYNLIELARERSR